MEVVLSELITLLTGGVVGMATGIGSGLQSLASNIFLKVSETGDPTGLSIVGGLVGVFGGIALSVGLSTKLFNWLTSLGN